MTPKRTFQNFQVIWWPFILFALFFSPIDQELWPLWKIVIKIRWRKCTKLYEYIVVKSCKWKQWWLRDPSDSNHNPDLTSLYHWWKNLSGNLTIWTTIMRCYVVAERQVMHGHHRKGEGVGRGGRVIKLADINLETNLFLLCSRMYLWSLPQESSRIKQPDNFCWWRGTSFIIRIIWKWWCCWTKPEHATPMPLRGHWDMAKLSTLRP